MVYGMDYKIDGIFLMVHGMDHIIDRIFLIVYGMNHIIDRIFFDSLRNGSYRQNFFDGARHR